MPASQSKKAADRSFGSFEEFEREFLPKRHAERVRSSGATEGMAARMAGESLAKMREAVEKTRQAIKK